MHMKVSIASALLATLLLAACGGSGSGSAAPDPSGDSASAGQSPQGAYAAYVIRAHIGEGVSMAQTARNLSASYYSQHKRWPRTNEQAQFLPAAEMTGEYVSSVDVGVRPGTVVVTFGGPKAGASLRGKVLAWTATVTDKGIRWHCDMSMTTIDAKYLSNACKQ